MNFVILHVNDLLTDIPENLMLLFADDTSIVKVIDQWNESQNKINKYLKKICKWLTLNEIPLNIEKTMYYFQQLREHSN